MLLFIKKTTFATINKSAGRKYLNYFKRNILQNFIPYFFMEIIGKLIQKLPLQSGISKTGNSWQKQEFVIETLEQYPRKVCANLWGDKTAVLEAMNIDDKVVMTFDLESREFNGKWYTDVKAWKLEPVAANPQAAQTTATSPTAAPANEQPQDFETFTDDGAGDDLPF
jgi:hypothetical protein